MTGINLYLSDADDDASHLVYWCSQVCSKQQQEVLDHGSKKSERLHDYLMNQTPSVTTTTDDSLDDGLRKALEHRDRLLEYDKTRYDNYY